MTTLSDIKTGCLINGIVSSGAVTRESRTRICYENSIFVFSAN